MTLACPVTSTLFIVSARADRLALGRRLAAPMLSARLQDHTQALRGVHPDLIELAPPGGKEKVGIDQVRELIRVAQYSPVQSERKVCLIPFAERLTAEAANALLKILEEPPRELAFALLADHPGSLLSTLVSRSRIVRVPAQGRGAISCELTSLGYSGDEAAWLAAAANREGELEPFLASHVAVADAREDARKAIREGGALAAISSSLGGDPIARREGLSSILTLSATRDVDFLTSGIRHLSSQERPVIFLFLQDLLSTCIELVREQIHPTEDGLTALPSFPEGALERFCTRIDGAHRALSAYSPPEGILLSLFLSLGGAPDAE
jgi:hypothetical protein